MHVAALTSTANNLKNFGQKSKEHLSKKVYVSSNALYYIYIIIIIIILYGMVVNISVN